MSGGIRRGLIVGLDAFFVVHPGYRFRSVFSWVLILSATAFGTLDLLTLL